MPSSEAIGRLLSRRRGRARLAGGAGRSGCRPTTQPSSSTPPARPDIPKARWSPMASISPRTRNIVEHYPTLREKPHRTVAYLPLCHVLGRDVAITLPLISQLVPHFGEDAEDLRRRCSRWRRRCCSRCRAICRNSRPRCWSASAIRRRSSARATRWRCAWRAGMRAGAGTAAPASQDARLRARPGLVFRPLLNKLGFDQLELVICGGAPLPPETHGALADAAASTSSRSTAKPRRRAASSAGQRGPFPAAGRCRHAASRLERALAEDGEILVRSDRFVRGLLAQRRRRRARCEADDGWLRTGDVGEWTATAALRLIDRARDFIVTAGGKTLSPSFIENALRA